MDRRECECEASKTMRTTKYRCSACDLDGHNRTTCPRVYTCKPLPRPHAWRTETQSLRQAVWEQLSLRLPKAPSQIFAEIRDDWGQVEERRLWNALRWHKDRRTVERRPITMEVEWRCGKIVEMPSFGYVRKAA